jgi:ribonuclease D
MDISLQKIYAILFGERISKNQRLTNWEADTLTEGQQHYAAIDAWACLRIYDHLRSGAFVPADSKFIIEPQKPESQELPN